MTIDVLAAEEDRVVARRTTEGTNLGPRGALPPAGKRARFSGVNLFRIANGKVVEIWDLRDDQGVLFGSYSMAATLNKS
jgi:predicted ester cyclase